MAYSPSYQVCLLLGVLALATIPGEIQGFYLPGMYPKAHANGTDVDVKVNSLTSIATGLPFSYYSLPFCQPEGGHKQVPENFGEYLIGDDIENSPYKFKMWVAERATKVCDTPALSEKEVDAFRVKVDDYYYVNMILDNLPAKAKIEQNPGNIPTGFPIGRKSPDGTQYYIHNHLSFKVLVHKYTETPLSSYAIGDSAAEVMPAVMGTMGTNTTGWLVVGFEVNPCSIARPADAKKPAGTALDVRDCLSDPQAIKAGEKIVYTYDVQWEESNIKWASRWDAYLKSRGDQVHWFSILNSLMVISFLAGMVFVILLRSVHRDLAKIEQMDKEEAAQMADESGWKLVVGDVFRAPPLPGFLCIVVANGVQLVCMAAVTIFFAALGFMSPASRGALLMGMVFLYLLSGIAAGYVAARMWLTLTGLPEGKVALALKIATFFPGITAVVLTVLNFVLWSYGSTGAVPFSVFFKLFALWFVVSVPLTVVGTHFGMKAEKLSAPVRTNQIPRQIPEQRYPPWLLVLGGGILPFGTLYIELYFIFGSMWMQHFYYGFGFLLVVLILLILVCAEVAVVFTYLQLTMEDYRWWWRSFLASGSVALYAFLYSINYLLVDLVKMRGTLAFLLFISYSTLSCFAIFLAMGSVGFLASSYFVYYIFSSVKLD